MNSGAGFTGAGGAAAGAPSTDLVDLLSRRVVGQDAALQHIVPYIQMYQSGLAPAGRPAGVFLLVGPTGTGKTRTVEALAEILHASSKHVVKIDCGEFQADHEVAKLIGAPPGYLGHRETQPRLTQQKLDAVTTSGSDLSLVLFDEIEKAAPSMVPLLLGILDKATLRLGDNTQVDFERSLIFLTSNLGARQMTAEMRPGVGFQVDRAGDHVELAGRLQAIGLAAVRRRFSPEFVNRIDVVIGYQPLDSSALAAILDHEVTELQQHVNTRLGERSFEIAVAPEAREFMVRVGTSPEYGARELKRTIHRHLTQPLAAMVAAGRVQPGALATVVLSADRERLEIQTEGGRPAPEMREPTLLVVDDNRSLLDWLEGVLSGVGCRLLLAGSVTEARHQATAHPPDAALLDVLLPDGDGVNLGLELCRRSPRPQIIIMTGTELSEEESAVCQRHEFPILRKPFLSRDVLEIVRARMLHGAAAAQASGGARARGERTSTE
jgi:CheY-like chemotaxis protein/energy-coupling factor transporter ATP-binding protein EcfA2